MSSTTFFSLIVIIILFFAAISIAQILKEIFEFLFKLVAGLIGLGIFMFFIFYSGHPSLSNDRQPNEKIYKKEKIEKTTESNQFNEDSSLNNILNSNNLQRVVYENKTKKTSNIVIEHHHYFHNNAQRKISDELVEFQQIPVKEKNLRRTSSVNGVSDNSDFPEFLSNDPIEESFNCDEKRIPSGNYVIVEGVYSTLENAQKQTTFLRNKGFSRANYFWAPCYESVITKKLYVVTLDRNCRSKNSVEIKKEKALKKFRKYKMNKHSLRIIQLFDNFHQNQVLQRANIL